MPLITHLQTRKERRKQERKKRKQHPIVRKAPENHLPVDSEVDCPPCERKSVKRRKGQDNSNSKESKKSNEVGDAYSHLDPHVAASMRRDDEEIAELENKLGLSKKKNKEKLNKEYAKLEGYGDDFGDFLDGLDEMMTRVTKSGDLESAEEEVDESSEDYQDDFHEIQASSKAATKGDPYAHLDPDVAAALRRDDEEIAELESKLGLGKKKEKSKLYKEYAKQEGYGEDFGDFLDDLDSMMMRVSKPSDGQDEEEDSMEYPNGGEENSSDEENEESSEGEELVAMKEPFDPHHEDDMYDEESGASKAEQETGEEHKADYSSGDSSSSSEAESQSESGSGNEDSDNSDQEPDHDERDTYRPARGEDIYGKIVDDAGSSDTKPQNYVPPHLRKKKDENTGDEQEHLRLIQRSLNNALNRLSEDSFIPVARSVAQLYSSHPTSMVHEMIWKNAKNACVLAPMLMTGLIPVYLACLIGVHIQTGDNVQLGEYLMEVTVSELWKELASARLKSSKNGKGNVDEEVVDKQCKITCNLMLVLCYVYNYKIAHCSLLYSVIRSLIENFSEIDIECLLLLLSHCGHSLRSDDPLALKEIVLLVQKKKSENARISASSRAEYMISAIMDLKNNKRRKQDTVHTEKIMKLRKLLGRIKSDVASSSSAKASSESSLRISLDDILNAESNGRWWKVGASWVGNQHRLTNDNGSKVLEKKTSSSLDHSPEQDETLLRLASKCRMNTDRKRVIFCIIMGGTDCDDAFEKLCRSGMLQNRSERDTVRVLMECCKIEKSYNKFYGHLASRICDYQPQCKFSLQLAFWDVFKQFSGMEVRKAANLAKLLFHLVVVHPVLKLMSVVKAIDVSDDNLDEASMVFLTIFLSSILEYFDDPNQVENLFSSQSHKSHDVEKMEEQEGFQASLLVFFLETLKKSPSNKKGSKFRSNYKAAVKALDSDGLENMF